MSAVLIVTVQVACDDCSRRFPGKGRTGAQVRDAAREAGWQIGASRGRDYCPEHAHEPGFHHP